jgi:hypothetical protein
MENEKVINESAPTEPHKAKAEAVSDKNNIDPADVSGWQKLKARKPLFNILRAIFIFICTILVSFSIILFILYGVPVLSEISPRNKSGVTSTQDLKKSAAYKKQISLMSKDIQRLSLKYNAYTSGQSYIVINTTENKFFLYTNKKLVREGFCSTGSLTMLKTEKGDKFWVFKTPKGKRSIHGKITNPSWNRPDWSFIEEGLPIPPKNSPARYESGVLGDYAMSIGDGYLIHGTIYKRFLGMPVTHGCVRLNDEDLKAVYNTLNIGSKVYIF